MKARAWVALLTFLFLSPAALAWSSGGHKLVALLAERQLTPEVRKEVYRLLRAQPEPEFRTMEMASVWPDAIRSREKSMEIHKNWHYIDIPILQGVPAPKHRARQNVVWALHYNLSILKDRRRSDRERAIALSWLIHLVGDVHQPLHTCSRYDRRCPQGDRGGNLLIIRTGQIPMPLHTYWDRAAGMFIDDPPRFRILAAARELLASFPRDTLSELKDARPAEWARESHDLAETVAYPGAQVDQTLSPEYVQKARATARRRLVVAGDRLADLLNQALR